MKAVDFQLHKDAGKIVELSLPFSRGCRRGQGVHLAHKAFLARKQRSAEDNKFHVNHDWTQLNRMRGGSCSRFVFLYVVP